MLIINRCEEETRIDLRIVKRSKYATELHKILIFKDLSWNIKERIYETIYNKQGYMVVIFKKFVGEKDSMGKRYKTRILRT